MNTRAIRQAILGVLSCFIPLALEAQNIWLQVPTPSSATAIDFFAVNNANHWFIADRVNGFYISTNQGTSWSQINSGLPSTRGWTIQVNPHNGDLIVSIYSPKNNGYPVHFYLSSNEGASWAQIPEPKFFHMSTATAQTGCLLPTATGGNLVCGGYFGPAGLTCFYSADDGTMTSICNNGEVSSVFGFLNDLVTNDFWMGTETTGVWRSTDGGANWTAASPDDTKIRDGNASGLTYDVQGNVLFGSQGGIWKGSGSNGNYTWTNVLGNSNTSAGKGLGRDSNGVLYYGHTHDTKNPIVVYRSTQDGNSGTWAEWDSGIPQHLAAQEFVVNPNDNKLYAVIEDEQTSTGYVYRTINPVQGGPPPGPPPCLGCPAALAAHRSSGLASTEPTHPSWRRNERSD